jgi:hypothetical protein
VETRTAAALVRSFEKKLLSKTFYDKSERPKLILSLCCDPLLTCNMFPGWCIIQPISLSGSGENDVVHIKRRTNMAEVAPLLHHPYSPL